MIKKITTVMCTVGAAATIAEANRLIEQDAVRIDGELVSDVHGYVPSDCFHLKVGKSKEFDVIISPEGIRWILA